MTPKPSGNRVVAWRCDDCTRLTIRLDRERDPQSCDHCPGGRLEPQPLRRTTDRRT